METVTNEMIWNELQSLKKMIGDFATVDNPIKVDFDISEFDPEGLKLVFEMIKMVQNESN
jgi:hypothetical protein